jgi:hypothetical protein
MCDSTSEVVSVECFCSYSPNRAASLLRPNKNRENEAMRDKQGREDRRWNEKRSSERPGVNLGSLSLKTRKQEVGRTPHVEHPDDLAA